MNRYGTLSHEQARHFRSQGYFRLLNVYDESEMTELKDFVYAEAEQETEYDHTDNPNHKLYGLYERNPTMLSKIIGKRALVGALESLLGPNIVFVKNRHNHATINSKTGVPAEGLHRDILQPTRGLVTAAVYLEDSTIDNGATRIIPGSHDLPYVGVPQENGGGTWLAEHEEYAGMDDQAISVPMPRGSVLLFNGLAFHGVGENLTGQPRTSVTLGFRSADELDANPDHDRQLIIHGQHAYRGNDR